ncbi:MAG TPA: MFS transporter [Solirubrobacteraceae bacterium]|nr:MFS transporter [Solirubrobacteraceae bacterium]
MRVLRLNDFRNLFIGQAASTVGDRIVFVALALYVTDIGSPSDVGIVLAAATLPLVGFLLIGGVWADRLPRHRVMIVTDLIRFSLHAVLAALIFTGTVEIWHIVAIEALFGAAEAFFRPAYTGLVPQTVPEELIQDAKAAGSTVETVAEFAGPALATALVLGLGAGWAFAIDAATFLVSAFFLTRVRPRERGVAPPRQSLVAELREGYAEVRSRAWIWVTVVAFAVALLLSFGPWTTLGPTIAEEEYGSTGVFGLLAAAMGAGTMLGAVLGFRWRPLHPMRAGFLWTLPWPAVTAAFALGAPLLLLVPLFATAGVGLALFGIWWETALAERVPPHTLSRVSAYDWMGSLALLPIGFLLAGPLGEALGSTVVLGVGSALATLVIAGGMAVRETWTLRRLEPV